MPFPGAGLVGVFYLLTYQGSPRVVCSRSRRGTQEKDCKIVDIVAISLRSAYYDREAKMESHLRMAPRGTNLNFRTVYFAGWRTTITFNRLRFGTQERPFLSYVGGIEKGGILHQARKTHPPRLRAKVAVKAIKAQGTVAHIKPKFGQPNEAGSRKSKCWPVCGGCSAVAASKPSSKKTRPTRRSAIAPGFSFSEIFLRGVQRYSDCFLGVLHHRAVVGNSTQLRCGLDIGHGNFY